MRQQLRLRVLAPLAVLALLGAGFGAYAFGQAPAPATSSLPLPTGSGATDTTPAADTTAAGDTGSTPTETEPPPEPAPGAVAPAVWVEGAEALCQEASGETVPPPRTPAEVDALLSESVGISRRFASDFEGLGWPEGQKEAALELQGIAYANADLLFAAREAFRDRRFQRLLSLAEREVKLVATWNTGVHELGAGRCVIEQKDSEDADAEAAVTHPLTGAEALRWVLYVFDVAVVVFYTPDVPTDLITVGEARRAALDTGAGFLAVDVTREDQVAGLAIGYEVLRAPTVLVLTRGPTLEARFDNFVDGKAIAQAVENAGR